MGSARALRFFAGAAIGLAASALPSSASAASWIATPSVAINQGRVMVAWTAGGVVQTATQNADGSFPRGVAVGRALRGTPPQLTVTPAGDQMLVWRSDRVVRAAFRLHGERLWKLTTVAAPSGFNVHVVMDPNGRAIAAWIAFQADGAAPQTLFVSTHPRGGVWSAPSVPDGGTVVVSVSLATDSAGDVVAEYGSGAGVKAVVLPAGAAEWGAPVKLSGTEEPRSLFAVTGGGARTFIARWNAINFPSPPPGQQWIPSIAREARIALPGAWSAPHDVVPTSYLDPVGYSRASATATAIDQLGNATTAWQFQIHDPRYPSYALGVAQLAASAEEWTPPATLDFPPTATWTDSAPSLALDESGTPTAAFVRGGRNDFHVVVATAPGPFGALQGQTIRIASLPTRSRCTTLTCAREWKVDPALAVADGAAAIAVQSRKREVVVLTRATPGGPWTGPIHLRGAGRTSFYLVSRRARAGVVHIAVTCALPPCDGVVELREAQTERLLGSRRFTFQAAGTAPGRFVMPLWAMARMRLGEYIRMKLSWDVTEGDGSKERQLLIVRMHARRGD